MDKPIVIHEVLATAYEHMESGEIVAGIEITGVDSEGNKHNYQGLMRADDFTDRIMPALVKVKEEVEKILSSKLN